MNPALDNNFSPNAEAIFIQLLLVMTSIKSKGITIPTNTLKQLFQGQANGVQAGAFLIRERQGGMGDRGQCGRGRGGRWVSPGLHKAFLRWETSEPPPTHRCAHASKSSSPAGPGGCWRGYCLWGQRSFRDVGTQQVACSEALRCLRLYCLEALGKVAVFIQAPSRRRLFCAC